MAWVRRTIDRLLWRVMFWVCRHFEAVPVVRADVEWAEHAAGALMELCECSGFLRDGRYPGGRHAERKVRGYARNVLRGLHGAKLSEAP